MQRSRLKNIINKSKGISLTGDSPFDKFKNSLPKELDVYKGDLYRLEAAWKAYGSPKDYEEALWYGLINPMFPTKMPSIGYNEETDEYEYLNTGKENETVAKDIRVWDNDVIPLVKELKLGGYVRTFNEEKNCWTYSKNPQKRIEPSENNELQVIEEFKLGGSSKKPYKEWLETVPQDRISNNYDLETAYKYLPLEELERWRTATPEQLESELYHLKSVAPDGNGDYIFLKKGREWENPEVIGELQLYFSGKTGLLFSHDLVFDEDLNRYFYKKKKGFNPQAFKQGGQMNIIPEGALHARKNNMDLAKEGEITHKGVPVIDNDGVQQAEVEKEEWTITKSLTEDIERWSKKFYDKNVPLKEKDEIAIRCGKRICLELLHNTDDRVGLIDLMEEKL